MKWLAAIVAFSLCTLIGYIRSSKIGARSEVLSLILHDLRQITAQLEYTSLPIGELLKKIDLSLPELWEKLSDRLSQGKSLVEAWQEVLEERSETPISALENDEIAVLNNFFSTFGTSDKETQKQNIKNACKQLESILNEVDKESKSKQKAFFTVGVLTGLALAVLML